MIEYSENPLIAAIQQFGETLATPGDYARGMLAGRPGDRVTPRGLLSAYGLVDPNATGVVPTVADLATGFVTDPLQLLPAAAAAGRWLGPATPSTTGAMLGLRRGFAMADDVDAAGVPAAVLGGNALEQAKAAKLAAIVGRTAGQAKVGGVYAIGHDAGAVFADRTRPVVTAPGGMSRAVDPIRRHEVVHGLIDQVAQGGSTRGLPWMIAMAGRLNRGLEPGTQSLRGGLGALAHELTAHTLAGRDGVDQFNRALKFLFWNNPASRLAYAEQIGRISPLVGTAYKYLPEATALTGVGGVLGMAGMDAAVNGPERIRLLEALARAGQPTLPAPVEQQPIAAPYYPVEQQQQQQPSLPALPAVGGDGGGLLWEFVRRNADRLRRPGDPGDVRGVPPQG